MKNLEYDIFISYAHANNKEKFKDHRGWMDHFNSKIKNCFEVVTGKKLNPWLDKEKLSCGDVLGKINDDGLENSRLFIPILSPPYIKSTWCRKEFLRFAELARQNNSLNINNKSRILPIVIFPYDDIEPEGEEEIKEFGLIKSIMNPGGDGEIIYQNFYYEKDYTKHQIKPNINEFNEQCENFSQILAKTLKEIIGTVIDKTDNKTGVFLGLTTSKSLKERENIFNELKNSRKYKKLNYDILPEESNYNFDALEKMNLDDFRVHGSGLIKSSNISLHLLDTLYGKTPEDSDHSYLELQYDLASSIAKGKNSKFKCLVHMPDTEISDPRQLKFIDKINSDIENYKNTIAKINYSNATEVGNILVKEVIKNEEITEEGLISDNREHVLLIFNSKDEDSELVKKIDDYIFENDIEVRKPRFNLTIKNEKDASKYLQDSLERCSKAIIVFGSKATFEWCNAIKIDLLKSVLELKSSINCKAICVADPMVVDRIRKVRSHDFQTINCEDDKFFDQLDEFLRHNLQ